MALQSEVTPLKRTETSTLVFVGLAPRDQPDLRSYLSLEEVCRVANAAGISTITIPLLAGSPGFHNANAMIGLFRRSAATHLFVAADDMLYPSHTIVKLLEDDKDIVNAIYRKRVLEKIEPANYTPEATEFVRKLKEKGVYETPWACGHTMMIKRAVIDKMHDDYPELHYEDDESALWLPMVNEHKILHDDWAFSFRARQSGFTIWEDFSLNCAHKAEGFQKFPDMTEGDL